MDSNEILVMLNELREQKISGEIDDIDNLSNEHEKWRNKLNYNLLDKYIKHSCEEIRITTLSLLVESKKSTLRFLEKELNVIMEFLKFNLGEKFEFVPLIKKVFKRINQSLAVFRRNVMQIEKFKSREKEATEDLELYQQREKEYVELANDSLSSIDSYRIFFINIREECLNGIRIGATHTRKKNSLSILQLQQDILENDFNDLSWSNEQVNKLFQCLLLDTYETNKEITFKIISKINPVTLNLTNFKKVDQLLDVAINLANCIRPLDSITASYMLRVCLMSPIIDQVLKKYNIQCNNDTLSQLIIVLLEHARISAELANENIIVAVAKRSLYGYIFCIRKLISSCDLRKVENKFWSIIIRDVISVCLNLYTAVSSVVNNSSPEGHFPMDLNKKYLGVDGDECELMKVTPQMVLLCSWRTVKEVSLLFGYLMIKSPIADDDSTIGLLSEQQIVDIGDHLVTLLCETKHRGAFEQAHVGFEQFCTRLWRLKQNHLNQLPKIWLYQLLMAITGLSPGNSKLCATRRSAGIPFMVQALVASEPSIKNKTEPVVFNSLMKILLDLTKIEDEFELSKKAMNLVEQQKFFSNLKIDQLKNYSSAITSGNFSDNVTITEVKMHVLNILRALFKHAQLRDLSKVYSSDGLIAAINSYDKKTWAERNAATLLFSALITRIFGVQRTKDHVNLTVHNKMTGRLFFEKYPQLLPFMLNKLNAFINDKNNPIRPSIQSILLLLSRLYLASNLDANFDWKVDEFVKLVSTCANSRIYTTRELAARAVVPLLTERTVCLFLNELFKKINTEASSGKPSRWNSIHGYILQALEITKSSLLVTCKLSEIYLEEFINNSMWIIRNVSCYNNRSACYPLAAAYIDLLYEFMKLYKYKKEQFPFTLYHKVLYESVTYVIKNQLKNQPGKEIFEYSTIKFFINWQLIIKLKYTLEEDEWVKVWGNILTHTNIQVQILAWTNIIETVRRKSEEFPVPTKNPLLVLAIHRACDELYKEEIGPDIQDAIQDFLFELDDKNNFNNLEIDEHTYCSIICPAVLNTFNKNIPHSPSFLRLFGKVFGKLLVNYTSQLSVQKTIDLNCQPYEIFYDNSWTSSAGIDSRLAIAKVIHDIYIDITTVKYEYIDNLKALLNWWTILLKLLVDDNSQVRTMALSALSKIETPDKIEYNSEESLEILFKKFSNCVLDNNAKFAAYFVWSLSLSENDFEMDDSDVFNKCYNYEAYEPLRISDMCGRYLEVQIHDKWNTESIFSTNLQQWLSQKLNMQISECKNAQALINAYKNRLPKLNQTLDDILDPTYNDKLIQILAFKNFLVLIDEKYCFDIWN
ncbi:thyroid adenoma-associated protein homolog [Microplitis demolitor]|uniref:thyroid adenoma-associated protein homolog n=1 Tax=Microplitis demolitor TaxID=69319 RepID=UPI0004CDD90C|nr:thyroid adenoma-associated protein homolog [Microplitis demolitor]XP_053594965.1 thyroid adenoma-associated protein homolog [Microplitis demolitor]XP_053594966.1 thyroid adenoma-associated protein homolog [Microplitis demolitor]XP_053594967.1 thyroid adenoma-associated protein homolog [Microplitis demolitor]